jgi:hypothetical protein
VGALKTYCEEMKFTVELKTYKDKILVLPLIEFAWAKNNKIFSIKFGVWKWALKANFNF